MHDRDSARGLVEDELSGPEYQREFSGPIREALDDFLEWLDQGTVDLGQILIPAGPLVVLLILIVIIAIILLVVRPRLQRTATTDQQLDIETGITSEDLRIRADRHAQAGNYDDAARDRFRALVRTAEEQGLLRGIDGRTATEIAQDLADTYGDHGHHIQHGAELFNRSRYGSTRLSSRDYEQLRDVDRQLQQAQPGHSPATSGPQLVAPR